MNSPQERLLVRGVNWLGDAVMTTPALLRLREARPAAFIALLTPARLAELWQQHPAVNATIAFDSRESPFRVGRRLRAERFHVTLVLPNSPRSALEMFLARIPRRIGYARPWRNFLLTERVPLRLGTRRMHKRSVQEIRGLIAGSTPRGPRNSPPSIHQIHEYLHLAATLGASVEPMPPRIIVTQPEVDAIRKRFGFRPDQTPKAKLFGLNPGAEYGPAKRWPRDRFVAAAVELQRRTGCHWWILGGGADRAMAAAMTDEIRNANAGTPEAAQCLAGQTSLRELCAALKACDLVLTNDTGPMHLAAAVGSPVVVPFGSTSPELTGPGLPGDRRHVLLQSDAPCSPCFLRECPIDFRCMQGISVDAVVTAVLKATGG